MYIYIDPLLTLLNGIIFSSDIWHQKRQRKRNIQVSLNNVFINTNNVSTMVTTTTKYPTNRWTDL